MRALLIVAAGVVLMGAGPVGDQFDLLCGEAKGPKDSFHFRLNLTAMEWCAGTCEVVNPIVAMTSGKITLLDRKKPLTGAPENLMEINRLTGKFHQIMDNYRYTRADDCRVLPYSGPSSSAQKF